MPKSRLDELLHGHLPELRKIVSRYRPGGAVERQELLHVATIGAWQALQEYDPACGVPEVSCVCRRAVLAIADHLRSVDHLHRSHRAAIRAGTEAAPAHVPVDDAFELQDQADGPEQIAMLHERLRLVARRVDELPEPARTLFRRLFSGESQSDIARADGVSINNVNVLALKCMPFLSGEADVPPVTRRSRWREAVSA